MVKLSTSNPRYKDVPLNVPPFQWSPDLSYWDSSMGAVSDSSRKTIWLTFSIQSIIVIAIIGFIMTSILIKPETRSKPYNLFLVFLMIPDLVYNSSGFVHLVNYMAGKYVSVEVCKFQGFILSFGGAANCHINALIALELYRMLRDSHGRKRYFPPSACQVSTRCLVSYMLVGIVALLWTLNFENFPGGVILTAGGASCAPSPYNLESALVYYLALASFALYIPFGICALVTLDVIRRGLLPKKGEGKRVLTMFFFRLLMVFIVFWTPTFVSIFLATNPWFTFVGGIWSHLQGAASAIAMLSKGDIHDCALELLVRSSFGLFSSFSRSTEPSQENKPADAPPGIALHTSSSIYCDDFSQEGEPEDPENPTLLDEKN